MPIPVVSTLALAPGAKITGLSYATAPDEPAAWGQVSDALNNLNWKDEVRAMPPGNVSLSAPGATTDGVTLANGDRLLLRNQTTATENGIYIWTGAAIALTRSPDADSFAELKSAVVSVNEGTAGAGTRWRQTQNNGTIGTTDILWSPDGSSAPSASESTSGIAELATQAETDTGTDDLRIVTPAKLRNSVYAFRSQGQLIGDGSATTFSMSHPYGTFDVEVSVREATGARRKVIVETDTPDVNTARVIFAAAPGANTYRMTVQRLS